MGARNRTHETGADLARRRGANWALRALQTANEARRSGRQTMSPPPPAAFEGENEAPEAATPAALPPLPELQRASGAEPGAVG